MTDNSTVTLPVNVITLTNAAGAVSVHAGGDAVVIDRQISYRAGTKPAPVQELKDGTLTLTDGCSECGIQYRLTVPPAVALNITDDADAVTVNGVTGQVRVDALAGAVTATSLGSPVVQVQDEAGAIKLGFTRPPRMVRARSEAGSVTVTVPGCPCNVSAAAPAGRVAVDVPDSPSALDTLTLFSQTGNVSVDKA